jgi:hypothetical protein
MHDDRENGGIAWLISPDHTTIAGRDRHTSWLFYSRSWKPNKEEFLVESIKKITQDNNGAPGLVQFTHLAMLLNLSPNQPPPLIGDTPRSTVGKIVNEQLSALTVAQSAGALTAPINAESSSSAADKPSNFKQNLSGQFKIRLKVMKSSEPNQNSGTQPNIKGQQDYNNIPKNDDLKPIGKGNESSNNPIESMKVKKTRITKKAILVPKQTGN